VDEYVDFAVARLSVNNTDSPRNWTFSKRKKKYSEIIIQFRLMKVIQQILQ
jgi:hypothetical protein